MKKRILFLISFLLAGSFLFGQEIQRVKITDLEKIIKESKNPMVINFWATWCKPCLEELPYYLEEAKKQKDKGLQLVLVSLDFSEAFPDALSKFVIKRNIKERVVWLDETDADYFCPKIDKKWSGAIPASLFINNNSGHRKFVEGELSHDELKKEIRMLL